MSPHIGKVSEKSNGWMKSYKAKSVILGNLGLFDHFSAPGDASRVLSQKIFYSAQLDMKIQLGAKFQEKTMDGSNVIR